MLAESEAPYEMSSASLLAEQPPTMAPEKERNDFDWDIAFAHFESRMNSMKNWRFSWWTYWSKLAEYILPRRYVWLVTANLMRRGNPINQAIIDGTAGLAKNICYTGMVNGLVPTTRKWFKRKPADENVKLDAEAETAIEQRENILYRALAMSNFYNQMAQVAEDEVVFGTAPIMMYEDSQTVFDFQTYCAGEYYCSTGGKNRVDTLYTEQTKTVEALVDFFGLDNCPQQVRDPWATGGGSLQNEFVLAMAVEPNFALDGKGPKRGKTIDVVKGGFAYREVYWLRGIKTQQPLSARGFHKKPFGVFRWAISGNDPYGRGPGMDALGDVIQLQVMTRRLNEAIEKQVRPPMGADPALKNEPASINPAKITYVNTDGGKKGFWSLFDVRIDLGGMEKVMASIQARIDKYFLVPVFMAITRMEGVQPRNNMEIAARREEAMQQLGPVIGLWKTEMHDILERCDESLERRGVYPPLPKSLRGVALKFDIIDMVTLAQLGAETAAMEEGFRVGGELSEAAKAATLPDPLRVVNLDEAFRVYLERNNFPARAIFSAQQVEQHDKIRMQQTQQKQLAMAPQATQPMVDAASALAKIPPSGGNSMLGQVLGNQGGGNAPAPPTLQ